jgi:hypothetical protein
MGGWVYEEERLEGVGASGEVGAVDAYSIHLFIFYKYQYTTTITCMQKKVLLRFCSYREKKRLLEAVLRGVLCCWGTARAKCKSM